MTLFDIDARIRSFLDSLYGSVDEDGVVEAVDFSELESLQAEREAKIESIALYVKELEIEAKALKDESDVLKQRATVATNKAKRLKKYLSDSLWAENAERLATAKDKTVFESTRCKLSFRKSEKLVVDEKELPKKYFTKKIELKPDGDAIKAILKAGGKVKGATLETNQNIQIK